MCLLVQEKKHATLAEEGDNEGIEQESPELGDRSQI